jgi:hypothetical protein
MAAASTTPVDIANQALLYVGSSQEINDLDTERTAEARACRRFYTRVRDSLLERFPWRFATLRANLALVAGEERSGWTYTYALPAKCITPQFIYAGEVMVSEENKIPFDVEALATAGTISGRCLLTNQENAELVYTAECPNVALWTPLFCDAVAWSLAARLCLVLPIKPEWASRAEVMAKQTFNEAGASQLRSRKQGPAPVSSYTSAR